MGALVGDLRETIEDLTVEWRVDNFFSLSDEADEWYYSPSFQFLGQPWYLLMYTNGQVKYETEGWIAVYLYAKQVWNSASVAFSISIKTADGEKCADRSFTHTFNKVEGCGSSTLVKRSEVVENKTTMVPSDVLTVTCSLKKHVPSFVSRTEELSRDFTQLYCDETNSDVIFRVEDLKGQLEDNRVHRSILGARSPVFAAMFSHDTEEKLKGVVSIKDCPAKAFHSFVHYLYTGKVEELSAGNVFDLFRVADKYQVKELADDCVNYMEDTLSADMFCDAVEVALNHGKENLLKRTIDMLSDEMEEIINTDQWQKFLLKDPVQANELLKKAFQRKKEN